MRKLAYLLSVVTAAAIGLAGCSSTPEATAPIASGTPGATTPRPASGPGTGGVTPPTLDVRPLTSQASGATDDLKKGLLGERSVFFEFDSNDVGEKYRPMLQAHAGYLSKNGSSKMMIQGNTDERGSREYNLALGQRRAEAVKRMLVLMGARDGQIETVSFGEEKPRRSGKTDADYAENRRGDMLYGNEF
ncbi:MAG: peptidoglycan-associated lipoprotein Pal [Burkholderiales bacterium]